MSRQSAATKQSVNETVCKNAIQGIKMNLMAIESKIISTQVELQDLMTIRDREQKHLINIYENGIDALTGAPAPEAGAKE